MSEQEDSIPVPNEEKLDDEYEPRDDGLSDSENDDVNLNEGLYNSDLYTGDNELRIGLDNIFITYIWQYLQYMLTPGNDANSFQPRYEDAPDAYDFIYDQTVATARNIVDDYLTVKDEPVSIQWEKAMQVADRIKDNYAVLSGLVSIDPDTYAYFASTPLSNLPILLLSSLGQVPVLFNSVTSETPNLYANEWNALAESGTSLCEMSGENYDNINHSYLWWLVNNIRKDRYINASFGDTPSLPGYTAETIYNNIAACYNSLDLKDIQKELNRIKRAHRSDESKLVRLQDKYNERPDDVTAKVIQQRINEYDLRTRNIREVEIALSQLGTPKVLPSNTEVFTKLLDLRNRQLKRQSLPGQDMIDITRELGMSIDPDVIDAIHNDADYRGQYLTYLLQEVQQL